MESLIAKLVSRYDSGSLTRRDLIRGLAMLTAVAAAPARSSEAAADFTFLHLEHVSITTENPERLAKFYIELLNLTQHPMHADGLIRLGLEGSDRTFIVFRRGKPDGAPIDHFAVSIDPFNKATIEADLKRRNIPTLTEAEFLVKDPDGNYCQMMADQSKR